MSGYTPTVFDIGATFTPLWAYEFAGVGGAGTLKGYYTDQNGRQCSPAVSITIPSSDGTASANFFTSVTKVVGGAAYVPDASCCGFYGVVGTADMYVGAGRLDQGGTGTARNAAWTAEAPQAGYPIVAQGNFIAFGRTS